MKTQNTIWFDNISDTIALNEENFKIFEQTVSSSIQAVLFQ